MRKLHTFVGGFDLFSKVSAYGAIGTAILLGYQNCTPQQFTPIPPSEIDAKLNASTIFGSRDGWANGTINVGPDGSSSGNIFGNGFDPATGSINIGGTGPAGGIINLPTSGGAAGSLPTSGDGSSGSLPTTGSGSTAGTTGTGSGGSTGGSSGTSSGGTPIATGDGSGGQPDYGTNNTAGNSGDRTPASVPGSNSGTSGTGSGTDSGSNTGTNTGSNTGSGSGTPAANSQNSSSVPVYFVCSNNDDRTYGSLKNSSSLKIAMKAVGAPASEAPACQFSATGVNQAILDSRKFDLTLIDRRCPNLKNGNYYIDVSDETPGKTGSLVSNRSGAPRNPKITKSGMGWGYLEGSQVPLIAAPNSALSTCQLNQSPLVVRLEGPNPNSLLLFLTSPLEGIMFDLLGSNATPAHSPVKISWFSRSSQFFYLALPDANGEVKGIDQLFGNETMGPDGQTASDGFDALAKFDGTSPDGRLPFGAPDGMITPADPIFSRLRLWQDQNLDGKSQPNELFTPQRMGIVAINLKYDEKYFEQDRHGNQIKYKSVVKTADGKLHLLFDLWFAVGGVNVN